MSQKLEELSAELHQRLDDATAALELLISAVSKGEEPTLIWKFLHDASVRDDKVSELAFAYEQITADKRIKLFSPEQQAYIYLHAVQFFGEVFGDTDGAVAYAERALATVPGHSGAIAVLEELLSDADQPARLAKLYLEQSAIEADPSQRLMMLSRAAELVDHVRGGDELAIEVYRKIIELEPAAAATRRALFDRLMLQGDVRAAINVLEQALLVEPPPSPEEKNAIEEQLLGVCLDQLADPTRALPFAEGLLAADPRHERALSVVKTLVENRTLSHRAAAALSDAYERAGDLQAAVDMLSMELQTVRGPRRVEVQRRLGVLRQDFLHDENGALELLGPVVAGDPGNDDLRRRFVELSLSLNEAGQAARLLSRALSTSRDSGVRARVGADVGSVFLKSGDTTRAQIAFQQVLETGRDEAAVLRAARHLTELYSEAGELKQLEQALEQVVRLEPEREPKQAAARRLTRLLEKSDGVDPERALVAWRALLGSPWTDEALTKLEELYETSGSEEGLADVLAYRAERCKDPEEARRLAFKAAELRALRAGDRASALEAWRSFSDKYGVTREVNSRMIQLLEQEEQWDELSKVIEKDIELAPEKERASLHTRRAQLRLRREDPEGALDALARALAADPTDRQSRMAAEKLLGEEQTRLGAADILEPLYRSEEPGTGLVRLLEIRGLFAADPEQRLAALAEAVDVAEGRLCDSARALELSGHGLSQAVRHRRELVLGWLERVQYFAGLAGEPAKRAELLLQALGDAAIDSVEMSALAQAAGEALAKSGELDGALAVYRRAMEFEPTMPELLRRIDDLYAQQGNPEERLNLYRGALQSESEPARKRELLHAIAALERRELGQPEAAIATWCTAIEHDPGDLVAHQGLIDAYTEAGDRRAAYDEFSRMLGHVQGERKNLCLLGLAEKAFELEDLPLSLGHYQELLSGSDPANHVLRRVEEIARTLSSWQLVSDMVRRRLANAAEPSERAELLEELGDVLWERLGDQDQALEAWLESARLSDSAARDESRALRLYKKLLSERPDHKEAAERLLELCARAGDWKSLGEAFEALLKSGDERKALLLLVGLEEQALAAKAQSEFVALADLALERVGSGPRGRHILLAKVRVLAADPARHDEVATLYRQLLELAGDEGLAEAEAFDAFLSATPPSPERMNDRRFLFEWRLERGGDPAALMIAWAQAEESVGEVARAAELFGRVLETNPERTDVLSDLARLEAARGDDEAALEYLTRLSQATLNESRWPIELQIAELLLEKLGRPDEALALIAPQLETDPSNAECLRLIRRALGLSESKVQAALLLERASQSSKDPAARAEVLEALLGALSDVEDLAEQRAAWLKQLLDSKSDDLDGSLRIAIKSATDNPGDEELWEAAERFARKLNRPAPVASAYAEAMERPLESEVAEMVGRRMVEFQEEWFDDSERVIGLLKRVLSLSPSASWAFDRLKLAFNAAGRWPELFLLYDAALERAPDDAQRIELLREASMAAKDFASDADRAMGYLELLNRLSPGDLRIESSLERLYERHERTRPLIELLEDRLAKAQPPARRELRTQIASLWLKLNESLPALELLEDSVREEGESEDVMALLEMLVTLPNARESMAPPAPGTKKVRRAKRLSVHARAAGMLKQYYEKSNRTQDQVRMLQVEVDAARSDKERVAGLKEIVDLSLQKLSDSARAFEAVSSLVVLEPGVDEHRALLKILASELLRQEQRAELLVTTGEGVQDAAVGAVLLAEAASTYEEELEKPDRAVELFQRVLSMDEDEELRRRAASRLDDLLRAAGRSSERCSVLELRAELESELSERKAALGEAARVATEELGDFPRAVQSFRRRLALDPADMQALVGLCQALEAAQNWDEFVSALEKRANLTTEPESRRADWIEIAKTHAVRRQDRSGAIRAYQVVLDLVPRDREAFDALCELFAREERYLELANLISEEALAETEPERRVGLYFRLGELHRSRTGNDLLSLESFVSAGAWDNAVEVAAAPRAERELSHGLCQTLLDRAVESLEAGPDPELLAGPRTAADWAIGELNRSLSEDGRYAEVMELLLFGSKLELGASRKRELKREAACLCSDKLGDSDRAIRLFKQLFDEDPSDDVARSSVTRLAVLLEEQERHEEVVALWEEQARCRAAAGDASGAAALWARAGELSEQRLDDLERAIESHRQGAGLGGEASLEALARIYSARGEHRRAAEVLEWLCAQSARELYGDRALSLAEAYLAASEAKRARARLEQAAQVALDASRIRKRLAEFYRDAKDHAALAALLTEEANRAATPAERLSLLRSSADLHISSRNDPESAVPLLKEAVPLDPENAELRLLLADALRRAERYPEAIEVLREQIALYGSRRPKDRALVHFELSRVCLAAGEPEVALTELNLAAKVDPAHPGILHALARLAFQRGELERAQQMYRGLLLVAGREERGPSRVEALLDLSEIATQQGDAARASEFIESAFESAHESERESAALDRILRERGRQDLLGRALETRLAQAPKPIEAARALSDLVALKTDSGCDERARSELGAQAKDIQARIEAEGITDDGAWAALGRSFERLGDSEAEDVVLERRVAGWVKTGATPNDARPFYRLAEKRLLDAKTRPEGLDFLERAVELDRDVERGVSLLETVTEPDPPDKRAALLMERWARASGDRRALSEALVVVCRLPSVPVEALREGVGLAVELDLPELSEKMLRSGLDASLSDEDSAWVRSELAELLARAGRTEEAMELKQKAASFLPPDRARSLLLDVARIAEGADDPRRAARVYQKLFERTPGDRQVWEPLLELYRRLGDGERLLSVIEETIPFVERREDRVKLRLEQAQVLLHNADQIDQGILLLKEIVEEDPSQLSAAMLLGEQLERSGRHAELCELLSVQLDAAKDRQDVPSIVSISAKLGSLLEAEGRTGEALDVHQAALDWDAKNSDSLEAVFRLTESGTDTFALADAIEGLVKVESGERAVALCTRLITLREEQFDTDGLTRALELGFDKAPADESVRDRLVTHYTEQGDHEKAAAVLMRAVQVTPDDATLVERLLSAYKAAGDNLAALSVLDELVEGSPDSAALRRERALVLEELSREEQALADWEKAHELSGQHARELSRALERAVARAEVPDDVRLTLRLVELMESTGDSPAAHARLLALSREWPQDREVLERLAALDERLGDHAGAATAYQRLVELSEGEAAVQAALRLTDASERAGRPEDARRGLENALGQAPENPELRARLRKLYETIGANRDLAELLRRDAEETNDPRAKFALLVKAGEMLLAPDGDPAEALALLGQARELSPQDPSVAVPMSQALSALGQNEGALSLLEEVVQASRGRRLKALAPVYRQISNIQLVEGFLTDALDALTKAFEMDHKNAELAMQLGSLALEIEEDEVAVRAFRSVTIMKAVSADDAGPTNELKSEAQFQLARLAHKQGDSRKAKVLVSKALAENPGHEAARTLLEQLG